MNGEQHTTLEVIAPTVEEGIEKGLFELGLPREAVDVEILDKGWKGVFGVGSRQVRIRLIVKDTFAPQPVTAQPTAEQTIASQVPPKGTDTTKSAEAPRLNANEEITLHVVHETVLELIEKMGITTAQITAQYIPADQAETQEHVRVDIRGNDLSILIGRRSETLRALQYIASLIVNKKLGKAVPLLIDVEGYRERRKHQLLSMAHRMAEQAVKTGRRQVLEPMPADERRLIHLELRDHPEVFTESIGEEPNRKVTIVPK